MAKTTEVILRAEVEHLGFPGDVVGVAPGYARNFLVPHGLAYLATEANKHRVAQERKKYEERLQQQKVQAEALARALATVELTFVEMAAPLRSEPIEIVFPNDVRARVPVGVDTTALTRVLEALGKAR